MSQLYSGMLHLNQTRECQTTHLPWVRWYDVLLLGHIAALSS